MSTLFHYNSFETKLEKSTKSLTVIFNKEEINLEFLFELESLLSWCTSRVEIKSIFFKSHNDFFLKGFTKEKLQNLKENRVKLLQKKLQTIIFAMHHLPQTIIMDLGKGTTNLGSEFALGADIRISHNHTSIDFDHSRLGIVCASGGITILNQLIGQVNARNILLGGFPADAHDLRAYGLVFKTYDEDSREEVSQRILENISNQCSVSRLQTKMALFEHIREFSEKQLKYDEHISNANFTTGDWKEEEPMKAKSMSYAVKLSLVKDEMDSSPNPEH